MKKYGLLLFKYGFYLLIFLLLSSIIGTIYFLYSNDAPILFGKIDHSIAYKNNLSLDIYYPTNKVHSQSPVLIYLHGGAWIVGTKQSINNARFNKTFNHLRRKGYTIISADYTLGEFKNPPFPASVKDVFELLNWIDTHASQYHLDKNNVGILGESAGAHLALMATFGDGKNFGVEKKIPIKYSIDVYGPSDLKKLYQQQSPKIDSIKLKTETLPNYMENHLDFANYLFPFNPKDTAALNNFGKLYSPINYIHSTQKIPVLIIHGTLDQVVPIDQSHVLAKKLKELKIPYKFYILDGVQHSFMFATPKQKNDLQKWIEDFVLENYHPN